MEKKTAINLLKINALTTKMSFKYAEKAKTKEEYEEAMQFVKSTLENIYELTKIIEKNE